MVGLNNVIDRIKSHFKFKSDEHSKLTKLFYMSMYIGIRGELYLHLPLL